MSWRVQPGSVGIFPIGALGVGFYYHLTRELTVMGDRVFFLERPGSLSSRHLRDRGEICIAVDGGQNCRIPVSALWRLNLIRCAEADWLPEIVLVCTQSDQLLPSVMHYVELLEWLHAREGIDTAIEQLPILVLCSNGIFHQRVRRFLVEALEESTLFGRLPELWSEPMGRIVGKLIRGVTIQTGQRDGRGADAVYHPGPAGRTRLAGGDPVHRERCGEVLRGMDGWFDVEETHTPTRVEFDKALINLCGNFLGILKAIDSAGAFKPLKVREIFPEPESAETRELVRHAVDIGRAVKAYRDDEKWERIYYGAMNAARGPLEHVPSTLKWIQSELRHGTLEAKLPPTEAWLVEPLIRFARTAGLTEAVDYFTTLVEQIEARLAMARSKAKTRINRVIG